MENSCFFLTFLNQGRNGRPQGRHRAFKCHVAQTDLGDAPVHRPVPRAPGHPRHLRHRLYQRGLHALHTGPSLLGWFLSCFRTTIFTQFAWQRISPLLKHAPARTSTRCDNHPHLFGNEPLTYRAVVLACDRRDCLVTLMCWGTFGRAFRACSSGPPRTCG